MKRSSILAKLLLAGALSSVAAFADMTVDKSNGVLNISSDKSGTVTAKIIGPDDQIIVNETYQGSSFSWTPSGANGAYRYDVRIEGDYAGGSVEVIGGELDQPKRKGE